VARNVEDVDRVVKLFEYVPEPVPEPQPPSQPGTATGQSS
jgi:hypothetical protein